MELIKRLDRYNLHFGFLEHSDDFSFEIHPERIIIRNDALRTNDRKLYANYLKQKFPQQATAALQSFDDTKKNLSKLTKTEALHLFAKYQVNILRSDIAVTESDAIFKAMVIPESELTGPENAEEKWIHDCVRPDDLLDRPYIWVDTSGLSK